MRLVFILELFCDQDKNIQEEGCKMKMDLDSSRKSLQRFEDIVYGDEVETLWRSTMALKCRAKTGSEEEKAFVARKRLLLIQLSTYTAKVNQFKKEFLFQVKYLEKDFDIIKDSNDSFKKEFDKAGETAE